MPLNSGKNDETTYDTTTEKSDKYYEIDWNKVQLIGDLKVILEKMNIRFNEDIIEEKDPILKYIKK